MNIDPQMILVAWLLVSLPLAFVALWAMNWWLQRPTAPRGNARLAIRVAVWTFTVFCVMLVATVSLTLLSFVAGAAFIVVMRMAFSRHRALERRALLWCLSTAATKGLPLEQAARAFAEDRADVIGYRARLLAEYLEAGTPLPEALSTARIWLPTDALVAMRVGIETGTLPTAVRKIARAETDLDLTVRAILEKYVYLGIIAMNLALVLVFMMLKIVPVFAKMFEEFELRLPAVTQLVVAVSSYVVSYWFVGFPLLVLFFAVFVVAKLYYMGWLPRDLPLLNRLALRHDGSVVMRSLSLAVEERISLDSMLALLAQVYPRSSVRLRLSSAENRIRQGSDWRESLRQVNLLRQVDVAVLHAAERAGNLGWALEEMADSTLRGLVYRMRLALNISFPLLLLVFGAVVAFHVIGLFVPLVSLIQGLS